MKLVDSLATFNLPPLVVFFQNEVSKSLTAFVYMYCIGISKSLCSKS